MFCFLFINNFVYIRYLLLSNALIYSVYILYLLWNYNIYLYYFDALFIIINNFSIQFLNSIYIMYDGISLLFIFLTLILYVVAIFSIQNVLYLNYLAFFLHLVILLTILTFVIFDLFLFYFLFEALLVPMFIIIILQGSRERKIIAAYKSFLYTFIGSISFFIQLFMLYIQFKTFNIQYLFIHLSIYLTYENIKIFYIFLFITFAIKIPLYPFHSQLPEAHAEAPTIGSIILAGILLKLGPYGLFRYLNFLYFVGAIYQRPLIYIFCILSLYYTSLIAIRQIDLKKLIAYSSISHMALVVLGLYTFTVEGCMGAFFLMLSHGFISGGLFYLIGCLYERYHTRLILYYGGLSQIMPRMTFIMFLFILGNFSFPFTLNFLAELYIIFGLIQCNFQLSILVIFSSIFILTYNLLFFTKIFFGKFTQNLNNIIYFDLTVREIQSCIILLFPVYFYGFHSVFIYNLMIKSIIFFLFFQTFEFFEINLLYFWDFLTFFFSKNF